MITIPPAACVHSALVSLVCCVKEQDMEPVTTIAQGKIKGKIAQDFLGGKYYSFQGIPYAKPPVGDLRFKPPQPAEPWSEIKDCTEERSECLAKDFILNEIVGSEDCLYLNVFTPQMPAEKEKLRPVMVWIHGGGFTSGSSKAIIYGPEFLITEDIVLVTINYRLNIFGFLSTEDPSVGCPGNFGFKDMCLALKWVQQNIRKFNGDPSNVTIFGESAGAASVHLLVVSPMAKGLFHKAIVQSGAAICPWAVGKPFVKELAEPLGLKTQDEGEILKYLKTMPADKLFEVSLKPYDGLEADIQRAYGAVIEKPSNEPAFLLETPLEILKNGKHNHVPIMIGYADKEGTFADYWYKESVGLENYVPNIDNFETKVPYYFKLPKGSEMSLKVAKMIKDFYFKGKDFTPEMLDSFYDLESDRFFIRGIQTSVKHHVRTAPEMPVYLYRFCIDAELNLMKKLGKMNFKGASHFDEIGYIFHNGIYKIPGPESREHTYIQKMIRLWANFAKFSNPTPNNNDTLLSVTWSPVTKDKLSFLEIGDKFIPGTDPEKERMKLWDEFSKLVPAAKDL